MIVLCRHGRTVANARRQLQGRLDLPLDDVGVTQAAAVAASVKAMWGEPSRVISSSLQRATQTAAAFGHDVAVDDRWIELDYGEWEGRPLAEVSATTWAAWRADPTLCAPGGETLVSLDQRVRTACADIVDEAREHLVVVVSHVSPIKAAVAWALGADIAMSWRCRLDHAAVSTIAIEAHGPVLTSFNEILWDQRR